jgi:hypothetical protein
MSQTVFVTLTIAGTNTGPFDLFTDADGYAFPVINNVPKASLQAGYLAVVPNGATIIRVKSDNPTCGNYIDLPITGTLPTTSTTSSTTSTSTTIEFVEMFFYGRHRPFSFAPPEMTFIYSLDGGVNWQLAGSFSDTDCLYRGGASVPKNSSMIVRVVEDANDPNSGWRSTRNMELSPIGTCPAFNPGDGVCEWPITTNSDKYLYFTVWNEDTGSC